MTLIPCRGDSVSQPLGLICQGPRGIVCLPPIRLLAHDTPLLLDHWPLLAGGILLINHAGLSRAPAQQPPRILNRCGLCGRAINTPLGGNLNRPRRLILLNRNARLPLSGSHSEAHTAHHAAASHAAPHAGSHALPHHAAAHPASHAVGGIIPLGITLDPAAAESAPSNVSRGPFGTDRLVVLNSRRAFQGLGIYGLIK
ncbi:MAG: hypothetical protein JW810_11415 [Sedimentisphaerales bacterium]|nr:hypothetical protein [Sedimentisphaerales bacterium]